MTYMTPQIIDMKYIPMLDMFFERVEDALAFYVRYARLADFNMRKNRKRNNDHTQEVKCLVRGEYKGGPGLDRTCGKTTKKKCQVMV
jgi:hypothetical protein